MLPHAVPLPYLSLVYAYKLYYSRLDMNMDQKMCRIEAGRVEPTHLIVLVFVDASVLVISNRP